VIEIVGMRNNELKFLERHKLMLHYFPIFLICLYRPLFYVGAALLYKCQPNHNEYFYICSGPYYSLDLTIGLIDWIRNGISMEMTILFVNIIVIVRHLIQRRAMKHSILTNDKRRQWVNLVFYLKSDFFFSFFCIKLNSVDQLNYYLLQ